MAHLTYLPTCPPAFMPTPPTPANALHHHTTTTCPPAPPTPAYPTHYLPAFTCTWFAHHHLPPRTHHHHTPSPTTPPARTATTTLQQAGSARHRRYAPHQRDPDISLAHHLLAPGRRRLSSIRQTYACCRRRFAHSKRDCIWSASDLCIPAWNMDERRSHRPLCVSTSYLCACRRTLRAVNRAVDGCVSSTDDGRARQPVSLLTV